MGHIQPWFDLGCCNFVMYTTEIKTNRKINRWDDPDLRQAIDKELKERRLADKGRLQLIHIHPQTRTP